MRRGTPAARSLLALLAAAALPACVSLHRTPEARFFVLHAQPGLQADAARPAVTGVVGLAPVRIPEHLQRPQLVRWAGPNELRIDEFLRWSEPLDAGLERTLAENLGALLPRARVARDPWPASAQLRCRVAVEVRLFGVQPDGGVRLEGRFALLPAREERVLAQRPFAFGRQAPPAGPAAPEPAASVEAMSELVGDLAAEVAAALASLPDTPALAP